jgi:hypothetical protein
LAGVKGLPLPPPGSILEQVGPQTGGLGRQDARDDSNILSRQLNLFGNFSKYKGFLLHISGIPRFTEIEKNLNI